MIPTETAPNPLREGLQVERTAPPCAVVIFGASGDLTRRKLVPALFRLAEQRLIPAEFAIVGISRSPMSDDEFRSRMRDAVITFTGAKRIDDQVWTSFAEGLFYLPGDISDLKTYTQLASLLDRLAKERGTGHNHVFYLSTAPAQYSDAIKNLGESGLARQSDEHWTRIIIEKPFGTDLDSARKLNVEVAAVFEEDQVYRIDHYLGKETVQNLIIFRFANGIFEPIWNRQYIDHVQITNAEVIGVEGRGAYYEGVGVVRDMIQNHVFQVLSLVAMEPPVSLAANSLRDEKIKAMQAVREIKPEDVASFAVRGQYAAWLR